MIELRFSRLLWMAMGILAFTTCIYAPAYSQAHARFVKNNGQWEPQVQYLVHLSGGNLFLENGQVTFNLVEKTDEHDHHYSGHTHGYTESHAFRVSFLNANKKAPIEGLNKYPDYHNYFLGSDRSRWAEKVPVYEGVEYKGIYPGINLTYKQKGDHLKYEFTLAAGADAALIAMAYEGIDRLEIIDENLVYETSVTKVTELKPYAYQDINGKRTEVPCRYKINGKVVSFEFPTGYDNTRPLVIDPVLVFASFTGSLGDNFGFTATYDSADNLYGGGIALEVGYPVTTGAAQSTFRGGTCDISISKFSSNGSTLLYSTYLGGNSSEVPNSLVVNSRGELMILGITGSNNFPVTAGAYDGTFNGGTGVNLPSNGASFTIGTDIIVAKLSNTGGLMASTYFGGTANDGLNLNDPTLLAFNYGDAFRGEIILDEQDNVYVATSTNSPKMNNVDGSAIDDSLSGQQDGFVFKMKNTLDSLYWQTYVGGTGVDATYSITFDNTGAVFVGGGTNSLDFPTTPGSHMQVPSGGRDGIVVKISNDGVTYLAATYVGTPSYDQAYFIKTGPDGNIYIYGQTEGAYPVTPGVYNVPNSSQFIHAFTPALATTVFSTVFGDGGHFINISPTAFLVDDCGNIFISGWGGAVNTIQNPNVASTFGLPTTPDAFQPGTDGSDFYFMVLSEYADSLVYATYFGGPVSAEHVDGGTSRFDRKGIIYQAVCAGCGANSDFPTTPGVVSQTNNSSNCNLGVIKFEFEIENLSVNIVARPATVGCAPYAVQFDATDINVTDYYWDFDDGDTSIIADPLHVFQDTGTYNVVLIASNPNLCQARIRSDTAFLTIVVKADTVVADFLPVIIEDCDSFVVQFNNNSLNAVQYSWDFGDNNTSTQTSPTHTYQLPGTYTITLIATDTGACSPRDTITRQLTFVPRLETDIALPDTFGCIPFTLVFDNNSTGTPGTTYTWNFGDGSTPVTTANPIHIYNTVGIYTVVLTAIDSGTCNVISHDTIIVDAGNDSINAAFVMDTLVNSCDSIQIQFVDGSTNATQYFWNFGDGDTSVLVSPLHGYTQPGTYGIELIVTNPTACNRRDTASAQVKLLPELTADIVNGDTTACVPLAIRFDNILQGDSLPVYTWNFGDGSGVSTDSSTLHIFTDGGVFPVILTVVDSNTCNITDGDTITITVIDDTIHAGFILDMLTNVCDTLLVNLTDTSYNASTIFWSFGDGDTSGIASPQHMYNEPDTFTIMQVVTSSTCLLRDTATAQVILLPEVVSAFTIPNGCVPYTTVAENNSLNATSYIWSLPDGTTTTDAEPPIDITLHGSYGYTLTAFNPNTCNQLSVYTAVVEVYDTPLAFFNTDTNVYEIFADVQFENGSTTPADYDWNFGDGTSSAEVNPIHRYRDEGMVQPCITVTDTHSCQARYCKDLEIIFRPIIGVPNAFSPNGIGPNDILYVNGYGVEEMEFRIYNRWGELVFESNSLEHGWDGTYKGEPQEMEVYAFTLSARFKNGYEITPIKGNITLLR